MSMETASLWYKQTGVDMVHMCGEKGGLLCGEKRAVVVTNRRLCHTQRVFLAKRQKTPTQTNTHYYHLHVSSMLCASSKMSTASRTLIFIAARTTGSSR